MSLYVTCNTLSLPVAQALTSACTAGVSDVVAQKITGRKYDFRRTIKLAVSIYNVCGLVLCASYLTSALGDVALRTALERSCGSLLAELPPAPVPREGRSQHGCQEGGHCMPVKGVLSNRV